MVKERSDLKKLRLKYMAHPVYCHMFNDTIKTPKNPKNLTERQPCFPPIFSLRWQLYLIDDPTTRWHRFPSIISIGSSRWLIPGRNVDQALSRLTRRNATSISSTEFETFYINFANVDCKGETNGARRKSQEFVRFKATL